MASTAGRTEREGRRSGRDDLRVAGFFAARVSFFDGRALPDSPDLPEEAARVAIAAFSFFFSALSSFRASLATRFACRWALRVRYASVRATFAFAAEVFTQRSARARSSRNSRTVGVA